MNGLVTREHAIAAATTVARNQGYAMAVHGTVTRDVDLIAVPWIVDCGVTPLMLAEMVAEALPGLIIGGATKKPHGRVAYAIHIDPNYQHGFDRWYVDFSVMPRRRKRGDTA